MDNLLRVFRAIFYSPEASLRQIAKSLKLSPTVVSNIVKSLYYGDVIDIISAGRSYLVKIPENRVTKSLLLSSEAAFTYKKLMEQPELLSINKECDILVVYGSRAADYYTDLSDTDIFCGTKEDLRALLKESLGRSIMRKHIILEGFESFVEVAFEWRNSYGVFH